MHRKGLHQTQDEAFDCLPALSVTALLKKGTWHKTTNTDADVP